MNEYDTPERIMGFSIIPESIRAEVYGFSIIEDTREQNPLDFGSVSDVPAIVRGLKTGDYSATGYEDLVTIERKSVTDLVNTVIHGRDRFERELQRMKDTHRLYAIFCEGTWADIRYHAYQGFSNPLSILGSLDAFASRYGVPTYYCSHPYYDFPDQNVLQYRAHRADAERRNRVEMAWRIANMVKYFVREQVGRREWDRRMRKLKKIEADYSAGMLEGRLSPDF